MNSFNHYAYGAIGDWMYRILAGIDTYEDGVGYKHSRIKPYIGGGFTNVSSSLETYYGTLSSEWKVEGRKIILNVQIPPNTTSTLYFPVTDHKLISEGGKPLSSINEIVVEANEEGYVVIKLGSGRYSFTY